MGLYKLFSASSSLLPKTCPKTMSTHNVARAQVGVGPIAWNETIAAYARNYASQRAGDYQLRHSGSPYGEKLAKTTPNLSGRDAVNMWIGERPFYDHGSNSCDRGECRHYTQVVWHNSVRLGYARVQCNDGLWFVTYNNDPPGNFIGQIWFVFI